jgi:hypothetical protein
MDSEQSPAPVLSPTSLSSVETVTPEPLATPDFFGAAKKPKKGRKVLFVILGIILVLIIAGATVYGLSIWNTKPKAKPVARPTSSTQTNATSAALTAATSSMTSGAQNESAITSTDDSAQAANASTSAGNVGDSVNENNF